MELLDTLEQILADKTLPQEEDYILAAQSLFRLQETYELDFTDLIQGFIDGIQIGAGYLFYISKAFRNYKIDGFCRRIISGRLLFHRTTINPTGRL